MDIKELSVGNYVRKPDGEPVLICLIKSVKHLGIGIKEVLLTNENGLSYYAEWLEVKELRPIPITPEWLQNNGFEWDKERLKATKKINKQTIEVVVQGDKWIAYYLKDKDVYHHEYCRQLIKHIHQLQNFLTLCGVELEIKM